MLSTIVKLPVGADGVAFTVNDAIVLLYAIGCELMALIEKELPLLARKLIL